LTVFTVLLLACKGTHTSAPALVSDANGSVLQDESRHDYESVLIPGVPHVLQRPDFCGEAVTESWLKALGSEITQDEVFALSGMNPERGMGATTRELRVALSRLGFEPGPGFISVKANRAADIDAQFALLHADLEHHVPSIVCMHADGRPNAPEHFRLVLGYDSPADEVIYHEPARKNAGYQRMDRRQFLALWPLKYDPVNWTLIRLRLAGTVVSSLPRGVGKHPAELAQHVMRLRSGKGRGFGLVIERPFVVLGDSSDSELRGFAERTVRFAVTRLKRDFFSKDPERILDIWLFRESSSYERNALRLFGSSPTTPFGYYSSEQSALVMNIATGGGTLVHEIVHPYIEVNFPECPAWFNEGLGSLFEQAGEREGHIVGFTNWRLAGLQKRIARGKLSSFETLLSTTSSQFYADDQGGNYAQARYLLYYLQEHGLLVPYYREFLVNQRTDPTGLSTLKHVLNESDIGAFQSRWERWVMGLRFPG
jgi:hypothetical protein